MLEQAIGAMIIYLQGIGQRVARADKEQAVPERNLAYLQEIFECEAMSCCKVD